MRGGFFASLVGSKLLTLTTFFTFPATLVAIIVRPELTEVEQIGRGWRSAFRFLVVGFVAGLLPYFFSFINFVPWAILVGRSIYYVIYFVRLLWLAFHFRPSVLSFWEKLLSPAPQRYTAVEKSQIAYWLAACPLMVAGIFLPPLRLAAAFVLLTSLLAAAHDLWRGGAGNSHGYLLFLEFSLLHLRVLGGAFGYIVPYVRADAVWQTLYYVVLSLVVYVLRLVMYRAVRFVSQGASFSDHRKLKDVVLFPLLFFEEFFTYLMFIKPEPVTWGILLPLTFIIAKKLVVHTGLSYDLYKALRRSAPGLSSVAEPLRPRHPDDIYAEEDSARGSRASPLREDVLSADGDDATVVHKHNPAADDPADTATANARWADARDAPSEGTDAAFLNEEDSRGGDSISASMHDVMTETSGSVLAFLATPNEARAFRHVGGIVHEALTDMAALVGGLFILILEFFLVSRRGGHFTCDHALADLDDMDYQSLCFTRSTLKYWREQTQTAHHNNSTHGATFSVKQLFFQLLLKAANFVVCLFRSSDLVLIFANLACVVLAHAVAFALTLLALHRRFGGVTLVNLASATALFSKNWIMYCLATTWIVDTAVSFDHA